MSFINTLTQMENNTNRINYERGRESLGSDKLDKQAFMQLLMAKLKYQDPMDPVKDDDFMMQQAQLAQVEKMDDLVKVMQNNTTLSQASTLVGKRVDVSDGYTTSTGVIESASLSNGTAGLTINGQTYTMDQIVKIYGNAE